MDQIEIYLLINRVLLLIVIALSIYWGLQVYLNNPREKLNQFFSLVCISFVFWPTFGYLTFFAPSVEQSIIWAKLAYVSATFFIVSFYYLFAYFFNEEKEHKKFNYFVSVCALLFVLLSTITDTIVKNIKIEEIGVIPMFGAGAYFFYGYALVVFLFIFYRFRANYSSATETKKKRIQYFFTGTLILIVLNIIFNIFIPIVYGSYELHQFGNYAPIFFIGFTAYAIVKQKLFGVKTALTGMLIGLMAILLAIDLFIFTDIFWIQIVKGIILFVFLLFGYSLVKSVIREIEQREELERVSSRLATTNVRLEAAYKKLQSLDKAKSEFLSIASHQLRTPLTAIKGYLSMIMEGRYGEVSDKAKEKMGDVYQSSERLIKLVNDLLNLSRIETGKMQLEPKEERIEDLVAEIVKDMHIVAEEKGIHLNLERPSTPLPEVFIDYDKIRQVILNIVDNALKYTTKGGVYIEIKKEKDSVLVIISDTGEGMTEEECSKMFQSFSRGSAGTILHTEGAGIGLYVSKRFVDMHKGKVWVESEGKGKGSTFYIKLPI